MAGVAHKQDAAGVGPFDRKAEDVIGRQGVAAFESHFATRPAIGGFEALKLDIHATVRGHGGELGGLLAAVEPQRNRLLGRHGFIARDRHQDLGQLGVANGPGRLDTFDGPIGPLRWRYLVGD